MAVRIRQWKGAWWVFINHQGSRKAKRIGTGESGKKAAKLVAQQIQARLALGQSALPSAVAGTTFKDYATTWLEHIKQVRKHTTHADYKKRLDQWILPHLGTFDLREITREKVRGLVTMQLDQGLSSKTVQNNIRCLSSLLSQALEDGLISVNVALKPGKFLPKVSNRRSINPYTRQEVAKLLETAREKTPRYYAFLLCTVRTGMRLGELLALQWEDLDLHGRLITVQRNYTHGKLSTPKSGESRRVDMSLELCQTLRDLRTERQLEATANGWEKVPVWVFCNENGELLDPDNLRHRVFYYLLDKAKLRKIRFHDLRHTFASLLLQQGESPVYVKEQMGHSSIQVTVDIYGHLIPGGNKAAVDRLDGAVDKPVFQVESATPAQPVGVGTEGDRMEVLDPIWCARQELNLRPAGSKPDALSN
jgi:integrase